ncbi:MAG: hypothetical protein Tsb002_23730 [Wenzhouxiangellaceae bacterium]
MTSLTNDIAPLAGEATELLKALAHPERLMICCQLRDTELSVSDIETTLGIKQPRLSRELSKLRDTGLVQTRKQSKLVFYTLSDKPRVREMVDAVCAVMLGKAAPKPAGPAAHPTLKPNRPGGYGVFARTGS